MERHRQTFRFVPVPKGEEYAVELLYVFESRETGEFEPGLDGEEVPVIQWDLHQYADMQILKSNLDGITYDHCQICLWVSNRLLSLQLRKGRL